MDAKNIGQDKSIQNPDDAVKQEQGTYENPALKTSEADKYGYAQVPFGPGPNPFGGMKSAGGSR